MLIMFVLWVIFGLCQNIIDFSLILSRFYSAMLKNWGAFFPFVFFKLQTLAQCSLCIGEVCYIFFF